MDYSSFKALQGLLYVAAVFGFGFWQLASLRKSRRDSAGRGSSGSGRSDIPSPAAAARESCRRDG